MTSTSETPTPATGVRLDRSVLTPLLDGKWAPYRHASRRRVEDPRYQQQYGLTVEQHRDRVLEQLHLLAEDEVARPMLPVHLGGENNHAANLAAFEELVLADPSLQIKSGVQFGLFASAILHLGTAKHHERWMDDVVSVRIPGIYAMTERGHGSDVASLGTTAVYDEATQTFDLHTPFDNAEKEFLGAAARDGRAAVVFARLITHGVDHGVHAFFVDVRDEDGALLPGITSTDDGVKGGLNGVDNGRLRFDHVPVPLFNLLDRYGQVAEDGSYTSPIPSPGRRFFTMLGTLVQGRVSLHGAVVRAAQGALAIAVGYAGERRQFPGADGAETVLMDYASHQRRLLVPLAGVYASAFAHEELLTAFNDVFDGTNDTDESREDLETLAAAMKATGTRLALDTVQECREACGGAGFMSENRLTGLRADLDVYATFEGDNTVLLQLVGKRLLGDYSSEMRNLDRDGMMRFALSRADVLTSRHTPWRRLAQSATDLGDPRRAATTLQDPDVQLDLLAGRARRMVEEIGLTLGEVAKSSAATQEKAFNQQQVKLLEAAKAHADVVRWTAFTTALEQVEDPGTRQVLTWLRDLYGLTAIEENLSWYLLNGRLSMSRARALSGYVDRLLHRLRPHAQDLVDSFGLSDDMLRAPIALGGEGERQDAAREHLRRERASATAPVSEKALWQRRKDEEKRRKTTATGAEAGSGAQSGAQSGSGSGSGPGGQSGTQSGTQSGVQSGPAGRGDDRETASAT